MLPAVPEVLEKATALGVVALAPRGGGLICSPIRKAFLVPCGVWQSRQEVDQEP